MSEKLVSVKQYHLSAEGVRIVFSRVDPEELEFTYEDKDGERRFTGRAIHREKTHLGFVATVVLEAVPDLQVVTLSLAVPDANRPENAKSIGISTFAVRTTSRTSIAGPDIVEGQLQTYETIQLEGNAW